MQNAGKAPSEPDVDALSDADFQKIAKVALTEAGLAIPDSKKALVQSRLSRRIRQLGVSRYAEYIPLIDDPTNRTERRELVSVLTTNVSSFFRERHHFKFLANELLRQFKSKLSSGQRVRIWSAGCSRGQEPYSIAMVCLENMPQAAGSDFLILATDIDAEVLKAARKGEYASQDLDELRVDTKNRFFRPLGRGDTFVVEDALRNVIRFRELNLHQDWPMRSQFDVIFCRNVVIYFDENRQRQLWPRFCDALAPGGHLILGHSERVHPIEGSGFESAGVTIYRKI